MDRSNSRFRRLLAEGFAIVVSILVAFAIDAAWDERQERQQLREVLSTLAADLEESLPLIESNGQRISADLERLRVLMAVEAGTSAELAQGVLDGILEAMIRPNTADNNTTAIKTSIADERLKRVDDPALRRTIVTWRQTIEELEERGRAIAGVESHSFELVAQHPVAARSFASYRTVGGDDQGDYAQIPIDAATALELISEPTVRALVARKIVQAESQLQQVRNLRRDADLLLVEVRRVVAEI